MNNKRVDWIDNAKFLGALCVIMGHHGISGRVGRIISSTIMFSFHMPLFFFINGLNKKQNDVDTKEFLIKRINTLFIPYVIAVFLQF